MGQWILPEWKMSKNHFLNFGIQKVIKEPTKIPLQSGIPLLIHQEPNVLCLQVLKSSTILTIKFGIKLS